MAMVSRPIEVPKFFHIDAFRITPLLRSCGDGSLIDDFCEDGFSIHARSSPRANQNEAVFEYRMHQLLDIVGYHETAPINHRERLRCAKQRPGAARANTELDL